MTGIERLRELADEYEEHSWSEAGRERGRLIRGIADRIEHDLKDERDRWDEELYEAQMDKTRVMAVYLEMERLLNGEELRGNDSLSRWARELREALGGEEHDPSKDVSMSAYDLLPADERDAIAWVRDHGGLEKIIQQRRDSVPRAAYERKLDKRLRHIAECEEALRRRNATISSLEKAADRSRKQIADMRPRLMPESMEWPRYTDGSLVEIEDEVVGPDYGEHINVDAVKFHVNGFTLFDKNGFDKWYESDARFERPTPKVLDADGAEIRVDDTVWTTHTGDKFVVKRIDPASGELCVFITDDAHKTGFWIDPQSLTHRAPVLAADGKPLREGETVWHKSGFAHGVVESIDAGSLMHTTRYRDESGAEYRDAAKDLTHERPVVDTWERLEEDAGCTAAKYNERRGTIFTTKQQVARDLVRRAKRLAERDR